MKVALYIRVSTVTQADEGYSLPAQELKLREYCKYNSYEIYNIYVDAGISGKDVKHRPAMCTLLEDVEKGLFDAVVVWKLTRFSRSLADLTRMCELLEANNVALISITEAFDSNTTTGRLVRNILGAIAQFEREVISENVRMAIEERVRRGLPTCTYALGYDKDKENDTLIVNEEEAIVVQFIFKEYIKTKNMLEVARRCNSAGFRGKRGAKFKSQNIYIILTRPLYIGLYSYHGKTHEGTFSAIIEKKVYNKVQKLLTS